MKNSYPRFFLPSLVAAVAFSIICAQAAAAQDATRTTPVAPAPAETTATAKAEAAPAKTEAANAAATEAAPAAKDSAAAEAKPTAAAPDKCACESPDDTDALAPRSEPVAAAGRQLFASAAAPSNADAPELFPRLALNDQQPTDPQHQKSGTASTQWTPLTYQQKMKRAAKNAFFSPLGVGRTLFSSALTQYNEDDQPHKTREDEFADFGTRFAINYSRRATRSLLGSGVYPVLFNQDPRYDRAPEGKGLIARAGHAVSRVFVQRGDGGEVQPAVSRWAGSLSASALSNLWERSTPGHDRIGTDATFKRFANSFVNDAINFLFVEFWPDIAKIFKR